MGPAGHWSSRSRRRRRRGNHLTETRSVREEYRGLRHRCRERDRLTDRRFPVKFVTLEHRLKTKSGSVRLVRLGSKRTRTEVFTPHAFPPFPSLPPSVILCLPTSLPVLESVSTPLRGEPTRSTPDCPCRPRSDTVRVVSCRGQGRGPGRPGLSKGGPQGRTRTGRVWFLLPLSCPRRALLVPLGPNPCRPPDTLLRGPTKVLTMK